MPKLIKVICLTLVVVAVSACQTTEQKGQIAGALVGGVLGSLIGGDNEITKLVATAVGAGVGAYIGGEIGRYLDEQDRIKAQSATKTALEQSVANGGRKVTSNWKSDENDGVSGAATAELSTDSGCFNVQEIATIPGKGEVRQVSKYCEDENGALARV